MSVNLERDTTDQMRNTLENYIKDLSEADRELAIYQSYNIGIYAADEDKYQIHHLIPAAEAQKFEKLFNNVFNDSESYYKREFNSEVHHSTFKLPGTSP